MMNPKSQLELIQLAEQKQSRVRKIWRVAMTIGYIGLCLAVLYGIMYAQERGGSGLATGVSFLGAATVFALQNFIASFFTYIYITFTGQYEKGDIIKIGDPRMTGTGEVVEIGIFSTTIKELDSELLFTGRQFTLPNQIFFTAGAFNYTKHNLLFWHSITTLLSVNSSCTCDELLDRYCEIVHHTHQELIKKYPQWYAQLHVHHPKYTYTITDRGVEVEVRLNIHFYNVLELNNLITCRLVDAHRNGLITLVEHKDYRGVFPSNQ